SLKKMGVVPLPPPPSQVKQPRNRDAENTVVVEVTDTQLLQLREEMEKPGDVRLLVVETKDVVLPAFGGGGLFAKREAAGAAPATKSTLSKDKDKDGKSVDETQDLKGRAQAAAQPEPRRKVTLHLLEVKTLPPDPEERLKK